MKKFISVFYHLFCSLVLIVLPLKLFAQNIPAVSPGEILEQRQERFYQIQAKEDPFEDSLWYHGRIYEFEIESNAGTPYFFNAVSIPGSLTYNGKLYKDLILSYNLISDEVIFWTKDNLGSMIQLVLNKYFVDSFTVKYYGRDYHFRLHTEMNPINNQLNEGFYEIVYDDELSMFVKHKKELSFDASNMNPSSYLYEKQVYLILGGQIYVLDSRRNYLKAFQDHKKSLLKYMRQEKINFDKSGTQILFALCEYSLSLLDN